MADEKALKEAIKLLRKGDKTAAREIFTDLLRSNQSNPEFWLWMSAAVETRQERIFCLENVLKLDPENSLAKRGLAMTRGIPDGEEPPVVPLVRRKWTLDTPQDDVPKTMLGRLWANPLLRLTMILSISLVFIAIMGGIIWTARNAEPPVVFITITLRPTDTPTATSTPTATPKIRTATPTLSGPTPLSALLLATYTPTPFYVNTPHPISEAYRIGIRAYENGDLSKMLTNLLQASRDNPDAADIKFLVGEAYRLKGQMEEAFQAYQEAIDLDNSFAPAYLGRGLSAFSNDPAQDILADLDKAIQLDPNYTQAYRERIKYAIYQQRFDDATQDIKKLDSLAPGDPWARLFEAQILLAQGNPKKALDSALKANELDLTLLPDYLVLAQCYLALDNADEALGKIQIYMFYPENQADALGWLVLSDARYQTGNFEGALEALDQAAEYITEQARNDPSAALQTALYRGRILLAMGKAQEAVNAFADGYRIDQRNFDINLGLGQAMYTANRYVDAIQQLNATENLAITDTQKAAVYYWRARAIDEGGNPSAAKVDYLALLALPESAALPEWLEYAARRMTILNPPTNTPTSTFTRAPSATLTPTKTPVPSKTATPTPSPVPSKTSTPTKTTGATKTSTPTKTAKP